MPGCDRPHKTRGWCGTHYARWRKYGDVQPYKPISNRGGTCIVDGCDRGNHGMGYCQTHYRRLMRTGSVADPAVIPIWEILACEGVYTLRDTARYFNLNYGQVQKIWNNAPDDAPEVEPPNIWDAELTVDLIVAETKVLLLRIDPVARRGLSPEQIAKQLGIGVAWLRQAHNYAGYSLSYNAYTGFWQQVELGVSICPGCGEQFHNWNSELCHKCVKKKYRNGQRFGPCKAEGCTRQANTVKTGLCNWHQAKATRAKQAG